MLAAAAVGYSCDRAEPAAEKRLLVVDGIEITLDDVAPFVAYLDSYQPEGGRKTKVQYVLEKHLLPMLCARRAFPAERAARFEQAKALAGVATNVYELEQQTANLGTKLRGNLSRTSARLPVSMFLFDPLNLGAVSQPIEVDVGWFVVAGHQMKEAPLVVGDYVDALQVAFVTHSATEWTEWWDAERRRIAGEVTFVHPDYRTAMPAWLNPPKNP